MRGRCVGAPARAATPAAVTNCAGLPGEHDADAVMESLMSPSLWSRMAVAVSMIASTVALDAVALVRYVGPNGRAGASGISRADPVGDIQAAIDEGLQAVRPDEGLEIRVLPGTYVRQQLVLRSSASGGGGIFIVGDGDRKHPAVFDGAGTDGPWLTVAPAQAPIGNLTVSKLEIRRYATAITLNGSRDINALAVTDVLIRENVFRSIGQTSKSQKTPSTAAVRLVNADRVRIVDNRFMDIRNRWSCGIIHAIYVAHGSTDNQVIGNTFEDSCGDAIRFRDASHNNRVEGNTFIDAWADAPISDWYCDSTSVKGCTKKTPECPSFGNVLMSNKVEIRQAKPPNTVTAHGTDSPALCPMPAEASGASRRQRFVDQ